MTFFHALYGLTVSLPFPCPYLPEAGSNSPPDVTVTFGQVPKFLKGAAASNDAGQTGYRWQAAPGRYLLKGGMRSARFLVEGGDRITIHPNARAEDERLLFHLLHSVSAAILRQRGFLVLHASTAHSDTGAIAFCGSSGAGKSTTLAALLQKGIAMLSDDITPLRFNGSGNVEAFPGPARMHLWDEAAQGIGLDLTEHIRHPMRRGKAALSTPNASSTEAAPLRRICILKTGAKPEIIRSTLQGAEKLDALMSCIYGPLLQEEHPGLFKLISATVDQAEIVHIQRPENRWTVDEIVEAVLNG